MRTIVIIIALAITSLMPTLAAHADELVVVVHARNPSKKVSKADVRAMLTGNKAFWHGVVPVKAIGRAPTCEAGKAQFAEILGMEPAQFTAQWTSRQLAGQGVPPETVADAATAATKVAAAPGGITIMTRAEAASLPAGVKAIAIEQ